MAVLNLLSQYTVTRPTGMWEALLGLFDFIANYGWRVILFTVLLKLVLSPLDFFQKYKMKKNQRITEMLKPDMDKLQKQYANDRTTLQQQQMKLQRAAGFSYFSSCIPMIITLVVFLTFFWGMRNISQYEEFKQYVELYDRYSESYTRLTGLDMTGTGEFQLDDNNTDFVVILDDWQKDNQEWLTDAQKMAITDSSVYKQDTDNWYKAMYSDWLLMKNYVKFFNANPVFPANASEYSDTGLLRGDGSFDIDKIMDSSNAKAASAKAEVLSALNSALALQDWGLKYDDNKLAAFADFDQIHDSYQNLDKETNIGQSIAVFLAVADIKAAEITYDYYAQNRPKFLWVKSLWVADVPWSDAIPNFNTFRKNVSKYFNSNSGGLPPEVLASLDSQTTYNKVMLKIREDKSVSGVNGFLIFAIMSVGFSVLSQFITTRQQKRSGQMTTAGGSMKMIMLIMPAITGVFAVMYTAAFSVYMITNSLMSLVINLISTVAINGIHKIKHRQDFSDTGIIKYGRRDPNDNIKKK